jgi:hypothetical protein
MDLSAPIRAALVGRSAITTELTAYKGSYPVFTRVPVPDDAPTLVLVVSSGFQAGEEDGLNDHRPLLLRDVLVYGLRSTDPSQDEYRAVERIAFEVRELFHRRRTAIVVPGWSVADIIADGPAPAPVDDEQTVGRRVSLTVKLARHN